MIMRITWGKLHHGMWHEFERAYRSTVVDKEIQGLQGRWLAQDESNPDGGFSVSLWETLEDVLAYERSAVYREVILPSLHPFFAGEYTTYHCDVKYPQE